MIRTEKSHLVTVAQTHPGMTGKNNEDRFAVSAYQISEKNRASVLLAVLSDGIGGHRAGEVAAEIAVNMISQRVASSDGRNPVGLLQQAIIEASAQIYEEAQSAPDRNGMGATCVAVLVIHDRVYAATVGDSRLYLLRAGRIQKLSTDHTWIQEALDAGVLAPDQVEGHPNAHVIRRYLGSPNPPQVDLRLRLNENETAAQSEGNQGFRLLPGDHLLMCSDGLSDLVKDHEILEAITTKPLNDAVNSLVDLANERGGHDNITIIALQAPELSAAQPEKPKVNKVLVGCIGAVVLAAILAGIVWGVLWWSGKRILPPGATPTGDVNLPAIPALTQTFASRATEKGAPPAEPKTQNTPRPVLPAPLEGGNTLTPWPTDIILPSPTVTLPSPETLQQPTGAPPESTPGS
ncbi:MAG: hypothetical protein HPY59_08870 [Anaerolineae bacterium]|nr:hypothetical protein [Anaerolineae bacterium]